MERENAIISLTKYCLMRSFAVSWPHIGSHGKERCNNIADQILLDEVVRRFMAYLQPWERHCNNIADQNLLDEVVRRFVASYLQPRKRVKQ